MFGGSERALPAGQADLLKWIDGVTPRSVEELELLSGLEPGRLSELLMELELAGICLLYTSCRRFTGIPFSFRATCSDAESF